MVSPFHLRVSALLMLALGVAACGETAAPVLITDRPAPSVLLRAGTAFNLQECVMDALDRITPSLEPNEQLEDVKASLRKVAAALETRQPQQLENPSRLFKEALEAYFAATEGRAFDPDAVVLRLLSEDLEAVALFPPLDTLRTN